MWLLALVAMVCAFYLPQLLTGTVQFDGVDVHYTSQRYFSDALRSGQLPFWTPYVFAGFPFLADLQVGAWYPLNWPFLSVLNLNFLPLSLLVRTTWTSGNGLPPAVIVPFTLALVAWDQAEAAAARKSKVTIAAKVNFVFIVVRASGFN